MCGCGSGTPPSAGVSDFGVFTTPHLVAAEVGAETEANGNNLGNGPFTDAEMRRYFETTLTDYNASKLRMDDMLDSNQRESAMLQAAQTSFIGSLAVAFAKAAAASTQPAAVPGLPPTTAPATQPDPALVDQFKTEFTQLLTAPVADSPFDRLDRVADFYAAYIIKKLRVRGDSRAIDPAMLKQLVLNALAGQGNAAELGKLISGVEASPAAQSTSTGSRLVLVVFQSHVVQGNMQDTWTGLRIKITAATGQPDGPKYVPDDVKVIRLHPTHTYDVDQVTFGQGAQQVFGLAAQGSASVPKVGAAASAQVTGAEEEEERERYLSRIDKTASFADAGDHSFGFNFYPSNVRVDRSYIPFGLLLTGQATTYAAHGYLESGGRDCAAILIVPRDLRSFTCRVRSVWGDIYGGAEHGETDPNTGRDFLVTLPPWDPLELAAATLGAGPTTRPAVSHRASGNRSRSRVSAGTPTTQPTANAPPTTTRSQR
jgi:hypothetical protein